MPNDTGSPFLPGSFFARAASRLDHDPPPTGAGTLGDDTLNPGMMPADMVLRDAAVLMPVVAHQNGVTMLLTQRTPHLAAHAGQIAFPGGRIDPEDKSPMDAALREAQEEIGLDRDHVEPIGYSDLYLSGTGYRIVPTVARVKPGFRLTINPAEVVETFEVPLAFVMGPENHQRHTREWRGMMRSYYAMPFGDRYIWGVTAGILRNIYERLYA